MHLRSSNLYEKRPAQTMEKIATSISGAGKTGQPHVKGWK